MLDYIRIFLSVTLITSLAVTNAYSTTTFPHKVLTIISPQGDEKKPLTPLRFELQESKNGLKVSLLFTEGKGEKPSLPPGGVGGGDYMIFLDEMIVITAPYKGSSLDISRDVPITTLQNGKHSLRCELRNQSGDIYKNEIQFMFDGSPAITMTDTVVDKAGMLDPSVKVDFLGDDNGAAGFIDVFLDERPLINAPIKTENTGKKIPLSQIIGKPISTVSLVPGTHLLTLKAMGINGNATASHTSFTVNSFPELKIIRDKKDGFQEAIATFLNTNDGYSGSVEVFFEQNLILSKRDRGATISITRDEIVEGLKKNKLQHRDTSVTFVFSLRAANNTENWQVVTIHP